MITVSMLILPGGISNIKCLPLTLNFFVVKTIVAFDF